MSTGWSEVEQEIAEALKEKRRLEWALQAARIVRALAECDAPVDNEFGYCNFCDAEHFPMSSNAHKPDCPWRMARELVGKPVGESRA